MPDDASELDLLRAEETVNGNASLVLIELAGGARRRDEIDAELVDGDGALCRYGFHDLTRPLSFGSAASRRASPNSVEPSVAIASVMAEPTVGHQDWVR